MIINIYYADVNVRTSTARRYKWKLFNGKEKNFSQGTDVKWFTQRFAEQDYNTIKTFMYEMNTVFKRLLLIPLPVIVAINGHAFGNGAILSCACDFRFMTKDKGFFWHLFNEMLLSVKRVTATELEQHNVIVNACENRADLLTQAMDYAGTFNKQRPIFAELKKRKHKEIIRIIEEEDPEYIEPLNLMMK